MNPEPYNFDGSGDIIRFKADVIGILSLDNRKLREEITSPNIGDAWFHVRVSGIRAKQAKVLVDEEAQLWRWSHARWSRDILTDGTVFHNICGGLYGGKITIYGAVARRKTRANKMNEKHRQLVWRKIQEYLDERLFLNGAIDGF